MKMPLLLICVIVCVLDFAQSEQCYNHSSDDVAEAWYCCNNHVEKNGACVECEIGYVSKDGFPCKPCSSGTWGRKCKDICSCQHNGRCDIVNGCVEMTIAVSEQLRSTYSEPRDVSPHLTTSGTFSETDKNDETFLKRDIILYSIIAGSIVIISALASCCFKYKRRDVHLNKSRSSRTHRDLVSSERSNAQYRQNNESAYDLIDEDTMIGNETLMRSIIRGEPVNPAMIRNETIVHEDESSSSYSEEDLADPPSEGYLNPYQPMIEVDVHGYRLLADESTPKSEQIFARSSDSRIISSVQAAGKIPSYEPTIPYVDVHNYTPVVEALTKYKDNEQIMYDSSEEKSVDAEEISELIKEIPITFAAASVGINNQEERESCLEEVH